MTSHTPFESLIYVVFNGVESLSVAGTDHEISCWVTGRARDHPTCKNLVKLKALEEFRFGPKKYCFWWLGTPNFFLRGLPPPSMRLLQAWDYPTKIILIHYNLEIGDRQALRTLSHTHTSHELEISLSQIGCAEQTLVCMAVSRFF